MASIIAVVTAVGVVVTILTNLTHIARFIQERREGRRVSAAVAAPLARGAPAADPGAAVAPGALAAATPSEPTQGPAALAAPTADPAILTPDQRIRVFVSSTLQELAPERQAVRKAIEALHLTPVMFELGARPHPPAALYRAYLAQSDVFVGIYGESYGWVAPDMEVSGLEDEYRAAAQKPNLIYVKEPAPNREERLSALLERVRNEARASYRRYATPEELGELIGNDLAVLLTERFHRPTAAPAALGARSAPPSHGVVEPVPILPMAPLPEPLTSFVGRRVPLERLLKLLRQPEARLVTLHGPGGVGKSRLALAAAHALAGAYADGVAFVPLDSVRDPELVPSEIAYALGLYETTAAGPMDRLVTVLQRRELLLVLDNVEGLLPAMGHIARLLAAARGLKVLVTSRALLRLSAEVSFPVPPMELPVEGEPLGAEEALAYGGVRLFVERVRAVRPDFWLDEESVPAVVDVCRRLDGLPLAIELAAARVSTIPVTALSERMTQRLPLLTGGPRDAPARQRTLRDTIAWSYQLLSAGERALFARMALFEGSAYLEAIENVLGLTPEVLDCLEALANASLLERPDPDEGRLGMLETLREFALERLAEDPELPALRRSHALYLLRLAESAPDGLRGRQQQEWLRRLRHEEANLRVAMAWLVEQGDAEGAMRLAVSLRPYWLRVGALEEGRRWLSQAAAVPGDVAPALRGKAALADGVLAWRQGALDEAGPLLEEAQRLARATGDPDSLRAALRMLGVLAQNHADYATAERLLEESLALSSGQGDLDVMASTHLSLGNAALDRCRSELAEEHYRESLALARKFGDAWGEALAIDNLSVAAWYRGDLDEAERLGGEAFAIYQELVLPSGCANIWHRYALLALARGDLDEAEAQARLALRVRRAQGEARGAAFVIYDLARVALERGDAESARTLLAEGLDLALPQGAPVLDALYLEGTVAYLALLGRYDEAFVLMRAAAAWRERLGVPVAPVNRRQQERLRQEVERRASRKELAGLEAEASRLGEREALAAAAAVLGIGGVERGAASA